MTDERNKKVEVTKETETEQDGNGTVTREEKITVEKKDPPIEKKKEEVEVKEETTTVTETHEED